ncbi:MAG: serine kinase [Nitrospirae bacterium]|nr:serine kinase [Nitrospirota bacterium]
MKVKDLVDQLSLDVRSFNDGLGNDITGAYVSDLLSDVMGNSKKGNVWITLQTHLNIVAVASMKDLSAIIIVGGRQAQEETIKKAEQEKVTILTTALPSFEASGKIYQILK